jgi:hypothetical protein
MKQAVVLVGDPPFPAKEHDGRMFAKLEHIWNAARRYAKRHGHRYVDSFGVEGVAPT